MWKELIGHGHEDKTQKKKLDRVKCSHLNTAEPWLVEERRAVGAIGYEGPLKMVSDGYGPRSVWAVIGAPGEGEGVSCKPFLVLGALLSGLGLGWV